MNRASDILKNKSAFSLAEVLVAMTISAMVLVAVLTIYSRAESSAAAITRKLDSSRLPSEVLQRIAEDLDTIVAASADTKVTVENKFENGFSTARLTILRNLYNDKDEKQTFEKIIWQTSYNNDVNSLVLYRSHSGIASEDKLLDEQKEDWERELFVPVCSGVTFFKIQVSVGENFQESWTGNELPKGVVVTISFAEPFKTLAGVLDVPEEEKITRNIAVDRTREIKFILAKKEENKEEQTDEEQEPNQTN
ncbi:MAG: prepilin-type N-terminal cleavage/methylation domain-containing protein [Phycisphaerae bacterium]|nr:prepilin-type N-terminal cleavage/methylation domain-containing protein [Phycisphaerae bacterium]